MHRVHDKLRMRHPCHPVTADAAALESAQADLLDDDVRSQVVIRSRHVAAFLFACAKAALKLRVHSLESVICGVRARKIALAARGSLFDRVRNRELVAAFNRLRPLVFSSRRIDPFSSLFSSLALIEFLALHGSFPTWVWGATRGPECTHHWVQQEGWVFNEPVEYVLRFTPILAA